MYEETGYLLFGRTACLVEMMGTGDVGREGILYRTFYFDYRAS